MHELESKWLEEAHELLETRPHNLTYAQIERDTGIKESWLRAFSKGAIKNPGVKPIETLINYLKG